MFIKMIARLFATLNSNASRGQVAAGMASGLLLALVPAGNLLWIVLFLLIFFTKVHYGMTLLVSAVFKLVLPLLGGPLDALGWAVLTAPALKPLFTSLNALPVAPLTRFNNTLVMGGLVAGLALWLPAYFGFRILVGLYRERWAERIASSKLGKAIKKLPLVGSIAKAVAGISGRASAS
ncbi:MAG: TIGR03546 family protein [Spirochaetales bacterium]|nr:TIGR03546 family protein [Spirochaetales bacterium]MBP7264073.1 TIGR03546 family protein [Spirochaetia bacterium]